VTRFYQMMQEIGDEMQAATGALCPNNRSEDGFGIIDLCMAPGGYTASALKYNPTAKAIGISLPPGQGGHEVLLNSSRSTILYHDITMFAKEFGVDEVPLGHLGRASFSVERPFINQRFDLVICDGQVLRTHKRPEYRERTEANRLISSQLILALQRIRHGGTLIILLHKIEALDTMELLYQFSQFSDIEVFKSKKKHAIRSSFYLIAKNVRPSADAGKVAVIAWKKAWLNATFGGEEGVGARRIEIDDNYAQKFIEIFGDRFTALARPVWRIQAGALSRTDFVR
jgi:23S rRNA U2552 (ribose-2'-O)-methylase RlmE/FtsJ